jgi:transcriptional regulator with XRE-family HTH domain
MKTNLQRLRKKAGYRSANDFADYAEINRGTYTNYEQGKRELTLERAWFFADLLDVTLDELAGRDFHPAPGADFADPRQTELNRCWERLDPERQDRLISTAHDMEAAKGVGGPALSQPATSAG